MLYLLSGDKTIADLLDGKQLYISFITELELLGYSKLEKKDLEQIKLFLDECTIIDISEQIKSNTINIRQNFHTKLPDSIIAATIQFLNIPLITADKGFKRIDFIDSVIYEY